MHKESRLLQLLGQAEMLAGKTNGTLKKVEAWTKYPDASILFEDPESLDTTPTIIFEVGFRESHQDLLSDMK